MRKDMHTYIGWIETPQGEYNGRQVWVKATGIRAAYDLIAAQTIEAEGEFVRGCNPDDENLFHHPSTVPA